MAVVSRVGIAWCALAVLAACGAENKAPSASLDRIRLPVGIAVHHGQVLVLSSNADLTNDEATGGSLLALAPDPVPAATVAIAGKLRVRSFGGELALARADVPGAGVPYAEACGAATDLGAAALSTPLALFGTRGSNTLNAVAVGAGSLSCDAPGARCGIVPSAGVGDPFPVAVACGGGRARAFFGFMSTPSAEAVIGELDLNDFGYRSAVLGIGPVRGLAYDRDRDRLFVTGLATGSQTPLRWLDLAGCTVGAGVAGGGCAVRSAFLPPIAIVSPWGIELRGIAFAPPATPGVPRGAGEPLRAYVTGRLYDASAAASVGYRSTDFGGVLLVIDLVDDAFGGVSLQVVTMLEIPRGPQTVQVLPRGSSWPAGRRDVVAVLSTAEGALTIYDDETGAVSLFRTDEVSTPGHVATGAPILGLEPYGLAVDPQTSGTTARVWVASYRESFVTPIDVTLQPELAATFAGSRQLKIAGTTP
jgi:hypothetical protein